MDSGLQKLTDTPSVRSVEAHTTDPLDPAPAVQHHLHRFLSRPYDRWSDCSVLCFVFLFLSSFCYHDLHPGLFNRLLTFSTACH